MFTGHNDGGYMLRETTYFPIKRLYESSLEFLPLFQGLNSPIPKIVIPSIFIETVSRKRLVVFFTCTLKKMKSSAFKLRSILVQIPLDRGSTGFFSPNVNNSFQVNLP